MQQETIFSLKGQARRLRTALQEMHTPVTHVVALNLIARANGQKNWEALEAGLSSSGLTALPPDEPILLRETTHEQWLRWLEAALLSQSCDETDLDDVLHDLYGPMEASAINNAGLRSQLEAVFDWHYEDALDDVTAARRNTVRHLEAQLGNVEIPLPEAERHCGIPDNAIPASVSVLAGTSAEQVLELDCLEWFANQEPSEIDALVKDGLSNSCSSDDLALWLEERSLNEPQRTRLHAMLGFMRQACAQASLADAVGITVSIDMDSVAEYVAICKERGVQFSPETLKSLGL